jgi:hypothetical protein
VDEDVAHTTHVVPRNLGIAIGHFIGQMARGLSDDLEIANDSVYRPVVGGKRLEGDPLGVLLDLGYRLEDILNP